MIENVPRLPIFLDTDLGQTALVRGGVHEQAESKKRCQEEQWEGFFQEHEYASSMRRVHSGSPIGYPRFHRGGFFARTGSREGSLPLTVWGLSLLPERGRSTGKPWVCARWKMVSGKGGAAG